MAGHGISPELFKVILHTKISLQRIVVPDPQVWPMVVIFINTPLIQVVTTLDLEQASESQKCSIQVTVMQYPSHSNGVSESQ